jgi:AsmA protein
VATTGTPPTVSAEQPVRRRGRIVVWVLLAILVLAVLVPPWINIGRYRVRTLQAIGSALGYEVTASHIYMRVFPRPGVVLSNFVISDDPAYSAEPMLRADKVVASFHLSSLWRGRFELGRLAFENPSLNLVRRSDGHWNVEELVQRSSHGSFAPTAARRPESRPRFPYIEATTGRINFKLGTVKKAFSFTDADFALWRESENEWGLRLRARPTRTDLALSDTGLLEVEGRFQHGRRLRDTPVLLKVDFTKGQLGQITKLIYGRDRGWRGGANASASLSGTPAELGVVLDAEVDDFRRYDIALGERLRLQAHCTGNFSSVTDSVSDVACESPVNPGTLRITGEAQNWGLESYRVAITAQQVPMDRLVAFARHAKKDLPADLNASGDADAAFQVMKLPGEAPQWAGGGRTSHLALHSNVLGSPLEIGELQFVVPALEAKPRPSAKAAASLASPHGDLRTQPAPPEGFALQVKPFSLPIGAASPAVASAYFDEQNYRARTSGPTEVNRLMQVARAFGIGMPGVGLTGKAEVEIEISGSWLGFSAPSANGLIQLQDVTAELQGVNEPLHIDSAKALLGNQAVNLTSFSAGFTSGPAVMGTASFPLHCTTPETCVLHFDVKMNQLSLARMNQLLNPAAQAGPWYRLLAIWQQRPEALLKLRANGRFEIAHVQMEHLLADNLQGQVQLNAGKVQLDILGSDLLGGHHSGRWTADFTLSPPRYVGGGALQKIAMDQLSSLMHDNWASGQASGTFAVAMQGADAPSLRDSLTGSLDFSWTTGSLRHVVLEGRTAPLAFSSLAGVAEIGQGKLAFNDCELKSGGTSFQLSGTAGFDRALNLRLQPAFGNSYAIAGPLDKPQVSPVPANPAQAQLR